MPKIGGPLFALLLVGVAFFGSNEGMQSWEARERDADIQHHATQNRYTAKGAITASHQTEAAPEESKEHHKNPDFFGPEWFLVYVSAALTTVTALLFWAASEPQRAARRVRSIIRGGGWRPVPNWFRIEASNGGSGAAQIETLQWGFAENGDFRIPPPYGPLFRSGEIIFPGVRTQLVRAVEAPEDFINPMIFFLFNYFDVNRRKFYSVAHVMDLGPIGQANLPTFIDSPPAPAIYSQDTFPLER